MLETLNGKRIAKVAHVGAFERLLHQLGAERAEAVRRELNRIIDELPPDHETGCRKFNSTYLGSELTPWPPPLSHLYEVAWELEGANADEEAVQDRAALFFGQFVWECIMNREELWVFYDPNISSFDPNREVTGKFYFERGG